ncbi:peptidase S9 [Thermosipho melanesiensis]|uniref:Peptidase S9, prolyl oligopeptidase active site domain protein n=2 Tax=Thermosipho melanesiensis TaxID=46541 RepID=A6LLG4_THEM4|nr:S9 family peptidase [Thermosipho melanesiensis]ABR30765.1 peptidase S9, prolyl oligopeptidase active site domain protein [Thermosipho melanesiensis BI429]APT73888.1 peptidase S9 [Thermosipho melanesiensis]OOC35828.1 peptidase S9 [Thermosipho melanesiensis]OOC38330.1 peptidase S9 [Thermosipho melanesiensis]OOC38791.1 peptidase S9 [Thermosipho melanesiensis]
MKKLEIRDLLKFKFISSLSFSPDGKFLGFVVHKMNEEENNYISNIWVYNTESKNLFQLTTFGRESNFIWLDNETILFPSIRDEKEKKRKEKGETFTIFYKISINGGEAEKYFEVPYIVRKIEKLNDQTFVLLVSSDKNIPDFTKPDEKEKQQALKKIKEEKDYEIIDEIPFWQNGAGFTNKKRTRLYLYNLKENTFIPLTDEFTNVIQFDIKNDKKKILFISNRYKNKMKIGADLFLYDVNSNTLEKLTHETSFRYTYAYFLDDSIIFAGSNMKKYGITENPKFYLLEPKTKHVTLLTPDFDLSLRNSVGTDCRYGSNKNAVTDENYFYFITTEWNSSYLNRINKEGKIEKLTKKGGSIDGFDAKNGKIYFVGFKDYKLQEIYELKDTETQITTFNEWVVKERKISKPERFTFLSGDGVKLEGWIIRPVDFDESKKYPAILDIHGGPKTVYGEVFFHEMQVWANEGYVVMFTNPRGSDGRGNEFADIRGKYGTVDYEDLMKFVDEALKRSPFIDKEKLGVTGGSYGGFMTNWIIGHTDRFKAAASQRSISNWISKFATTDIGYFFVEDQHASNPWNNYEKLWWHSPMKYADKIKTPTLFIHSEEDYRCWLAEGIQMFTSLKYFGVESRLVLFKGENHELSRSGKPKHRIRRLKEITEWFNKYLK